MKRINDDVAVLGTLSAQRLCGDFNLTEKHYREIDRRTADKLTDATAPIFDAVTELARQVDELREQLDQARAEIAALTEQLNKNIIL